MSRECSWLVSCPFFQKYKHLDADEANRLKRLYCKGPYMDQCVRKLYKELHGSDSPAQMNPEGKILEDEDYEAACACECMSRKAQCG